MTLERLAEIRKEAAGWSTEYEPDSPMSYSAVGHRAELLAYVDQLETDRDRAIAEAEIALSERIVARILAIANTLKPNHRRYRAYHAGLLTAAGEANVEHLFQPDATTANHPTGDTSMITPERKHELAVELAVEIAKQALATTVPGILFAQLIETDDLGSLPPLEFFDVCKEIASLIRTGKPIVTFPELYVGQGDGESVSTPDNENEA